MLNRFRLFSSRRTFGSNSFVRSEPSLWNRIGIKMHRLIDLTFGPQQHVQQPQQYIQQPRQYIEQPLATKADLLSNYDDVEDLISDYEEFHHTVEPEFMEEIADHEGVESIAELVSNLKAVRPENITRRFQLYKPTTLSDLGINYPETNEEIVKFCCCVPVHKDSQQDKITYLHPNLAAIGVVNSAIKTLDVGVAWITDKDFEDAFTRQIEKGVTVRIVCSHSTIPQMRNIMDYYDKVRGVYPNASIELKFACGAPGKQSFFHNKFVSCDEGKCCYVGSNNWSDGSWNFHWESGVLFVNHPIGDKVNEFFTYVWNFGIPPVEPYPGTMKSRLSNHIPKRPRKKIN